MAQRPVLTYRENHKQRGEDARERVHSRVYGGGGTEDAYPTTRPVLEYIEPPKPLGSSFSGDERTSILNVPNAIESFQQRHTIPDFMQAKLDNRPGSMRAIEEFEQKAPTPTPKQAFYDREGAARAEQLEGAPGFIRKPLEYIGHG